LQIIGVKKNYEEMSQVAAELIVEYLRRKGDLLLCAAAGATPTLTYKLLREKKQTAPNLFKEMRVLKLDEWGGLAMDDPATCEVYLQNNLIKPLGISVGRYISFCSNSENPERESEKIHQKLCEIGPIDFCVLGLGLNGHLALNEPSIELRPFAHVVGLSDASLKHPMLEKASVKPDYGLSLGLAEIFSAKKILLLVSGKNKNAAMRRVFTKRLSTHFPASLLWLHHNTVCLCDEDAARGIDVNS
jgi:galactosamine-6-phosphate isomerase